MGIDDGGLVTEEDEQEETHEYTVNFYVATRYTSSEVTAEFSLYDDYGFTDQEWDEMKEYERNDHFYEWLEEWVQGEIDSGGEVG